MSATAQKPDRMVVDRVPPGEWHAIYLCRATESRTRDCVAVLVDVHPDDLKHCNCKVAFLFVHPDEYCPDGARRAWLAILSPSWKISTVSVVIRASIIPRINRDGTDWKWPAISI